MSFKRFALCIAFLFLGLSLASMAQAGHGKKYLLSGGGAQFQIGGGLPLPIQPVITTGAGNATVTGSVFPTLLIPPKAGVIINQGTPVGLGAKLSVPAAAFSKPASQFTLGVFSQNPALYAVATNLNYKWPAAQAAFSAGGRGGTASAVLTGGLNGNTAAYTAGINQFGGAAGFMLSGGPPTGVLPSGPVTVFIIALGPPGFPPCVHTALTPVPFPVAGSPACVAALVQAVPTGTGVIGGPNGATANTPGGFGGLPPIPGVGIGAFGTGPLHPIGPPGTVSFFALLAKGTGLTNAASLRDVSASGTSAVQAATAAYKRIHPRVVKLAIVFASEWVFR